MAGRESSLPMQSNLPRALNIAVSGAFFLIVSCAVMNARSAQDLEQPLTLSGYRIGPQDVIGITVWGHPELSGKFSIGADGKLTFPLLGPLKAAGRLASEVEVELTQRLADGFLKNPRVSIEIQQYLSQRLFVMGEVRTPGAIPLTGAMTLLEAIARAGSITEQAGGEIVVLRGPSEQARFGPLALGRDGASEVGRVTVQELRRGTLMTNISLRDGDTVFVPRAETIYVLGQVRSPGAHTLVSGMTVLNAISQAGGTTPLGSTGRVRIVRIVDGIKKELKPKLDDRLQPGDTLFVGARIF